MIDAFDRRILQLRAANSELELLAYILCSCQYVDELIPGFNCRPNFNEPSLNIHRSRSHIFVTGYPTAIWLNIVFP